MFRIKTTKGEVSINPSHVAAIAPTITGTTLPKGREPGVILTGVILYMDFGGEFVIPDMTLEQAEVLVVRG